LYSKPEKFPKYHVQLKSILKSVLIIAIVAVAMIGVMVPNADAANLVTNNYFLEVAEEPERYTDSNVKLSGQINVKQVFENSISYIFNVGGVDNSNRDEIVFYTERTHQEFSEDDCLVIEGIIRGTTELTNKKYVSGWDVPYIWLDDYSEIDCLEALYPTIAESTVSQTQHMGGAKVTIEKVQWSDHHTRILLTVDNTSQNNEITIYQHNSVLIQDRTQFESESVCCSIDYLDSTIPYGLLSEGWWVFESTDPESFEIRATVREYPQVGGLKTYDMTFIINSIHYVFDASTAPIPNPVKSDAEIIDDSGPPFELKQKIAKYMESHSMATTISPENVIFIKPNSGIPGCEEDDSCLFNSVTEIEVGQTVGWINFDSVVHTITSGTISKISEAGTVFASGMISTSEDKENSFYLSTFNAPGTFDYFDKLHPWITGKIIVNSLFGIASFVDQSKDPQHYIDRYNNEPKYKEWFNENYSQYSSIYQAVGLAEPVAVVEPVVVVKPVVEYIPEPTVEVASTPNCGTGTESVNGVCQVIQTKEKSSKGGGCLIATATYGSEMAVEVQQLRELRDNQLLNTESGTQFMGTFNDIYYSFSPTIADMERENPLFKEAVKLAITPMISSLSLMENANSESEVLSIGISVIALNLGMYLAVPAVVIIGIRKRF
jgi:plastocyanin